MKKKQGSKKKWIILVIVLILAAVGGYFFLHGKGDTERRMNRTNVKPQDVIRGTIRVTTEGNGSIEAANEKTFSSEYTLKMASVEVENGDVVTKGDVIAIIDRDSIKDQITLLEGELSQANSEIKGMDESGSTDLSSPVEGRVKRIFAKADDILTEVVAANGGIMELSADGRLKVEFKSMKSLKIGEEVTVSFLNYDVDGIIFSKEDGVYTATFKDNADYPVDAEATVTDKKDEILGTGIVLSNHPYLLDASYGIVDEITVDTGDFVDAGERVLTRYSTSYNRDYLRAIEDRAEIMEKLQALRQLDKDPTLYAEESGIVSELALVDDTISAEDTQMYHLISTEKFWLKTEIDELDIADVTVGQTASIVFDAFDDEEYEGKVEKISSLGTNVGGVTKYTVTISIPGIEKVKTAMSATATIVTDEAEDVLLVPVDAVQIVDGQKCVTVLEGEEQKIVPVTLGLVNNTQAEVVEGLSEGDQILVIGKSDLEKMMDVMKQSREAVSGGEG